MKKERNRLRMQKQRQLPTAKRQRTDVGPVPVPVERLRVVEINIPTKRKGIAREDGGTQKRKRLGNDIRTYMTQENGDSYMVKSIMAAGAECSTSKNSEQASCCMPRPSRDGETSDRCGSDG